MRRPPWDGGVQKRDPGRRHWVAPDGVPLGGHLSTLLRLSQWIDLANEKVGVIADWMIVLSCLISAGNAMIRYAFDMSSNGWLEVQWYMFAVAVMFGASYTLKKN